MSSNFKDIAAKLVLAAETFGQMSQYLSKEEIEKLRNAIIISPKPELRSLRLRLHVRWREAQPIVFALSTTGHTLQHHCLSSFNITKFKAKKIVTGYMGAKKKGGKINKIIAGAENRMKSRTLTSQFILRCRAIGVDIDTFDLGEKPQVCSSCAFVSLNVATATAEWMTVQFLAIVGSNFNKKKSVKCKGGSIDVSWEGHLGGYTMFAPIAAIGSDILSGVIGFEPNQQFGAISQTICQLLPKFKDKESEENNLQLLLYVAEQCTIPISLNTGYIKAVFVVKDNAFGIYSMYPTPTKD